jgi:hypothetical protein
MSDAYLSFGAQAMRYFMREHSDVCRQPIRSAAAWRGPELKPQDWSIELAAAEIAELDAALAQIKRRGIDIAHMQRTDFVLPNLSSRLADCAAEVRSGRGFVLLRGLPVQRWGDEDTARVYWGIGLQLGTPGAQNPAGELLGHVTD